MIKKKLEFGKTFCVLPWIENYTDLSGNILFCCWSKTPIRDFAQADQLRNQIWNDQKIPHCKICYDLEQHKTISPRQIETLRWFKSNKELSDYFNKNDCPPANPLFLDLRTDNKCNLACVSCNPTQSSLWAKELSIPIIQSKKKLDLNEAIKYKKIYMAGGEPLIIEDYLILLKHIADNNLNIEIVINTNLTSLSNDVIQLMKAIKNISLIVSVDAYGKVNEYHRFPLKWSKFVSNLEIVKNLDIPIHFNTVVDAVSVFGMANLQNISHFPESWNLTLLIDPSWLKLCNIPDKHKKLAHDNIIELKRNRFFLTNLSFSTRIKQMENELFQSGNSNELIEKIKELDARRNINHSDYLGFDISK